MLRTKTRTKTVVTALLLVVLGLCGGSGAAHASEAGAESLHLSGDNDNLASYHAASGQTAPCVFGNNTSQLKVGRGAARSLMVGARAGACDANLSIAFDGSTAQENPVGSDERANYDAVATSPILGEPAFAEAGLLNKAGVFYFGGFEGSPWETTMKATSPNRPQNLLVVSDSNAFQSKSLRVLYPTGSQSDAPEPTPGKGGTAWEIKFDSSGLDLGGKDEVFIRYYVRFQPNFQFVRGGKLPGMAGGTPQGDGDIPTGYDGWSGRLMWRTGGTVVNYMYLPTSRNEGTDLIWDHGGTARSFVPGRWHCLEMQYKMNTPGSSDGLARGWFDGSLALEKTNLRYRKTTRLKIDKLLFSTFFGGGSSEWASPSDQYIDFDNIVMSTQGIGCIDGNDVTPNPSFDGDKSDGTPDSDFDGDGVARSPVGFDCDDGNAAIKPGAREIFGNGVDENCDGADEEWRNVATRYTAAWGIRGERAYFKKLTFAQIERGTRISLRCRGRRRCPVHYTRKFSEPARAFSLTRKMRGRYVRAGMTVELRITAPDRMGRVVRWTMRGRRIPAIRTLCLPPRQSVPRVC